MRPDQAHIRSASTRSATKDRVQTGLMEQEFSLDGATFSETIEKAIQINAAEIAQLRAKMNELEARDEQLRRLASLGHQYENGSNSIPDSFGKKRRERRSSMAWKIRREVFLILKRVNRPLNRTELLRELQKAGVVLQAQDPLAVITKIMWNTAEFISTGDGYWLAGEPLPSAIGLTESSRIGNV